MVFTRNGQEQPSCRIKEPIAAWGSARDASSLSTKKDTESTNCPNDAALITIQMFGVTLNGGDCLLGIIAADGQRAPGAKSKNAWSGFVR